MADTLSAKEAARELGTDARTFRKFMRATTPKETQPGQGNRYNIDPDDVPKLKRKFAEWNTKKEKAEKPPLVEAIGEVDGDEDFELFDDEVISDDLEEVDDEDDVPDFSDTDESDEPSDEELMEIEASEEIDISDLEEL